MSVDILENQNHLSQITSSFLLSFEKKLSLAWKKNGVLIQLISVAIFMD